jgi:hypothetical protein
MKATIDIPDDLYRRVKAKSALRGQAVREVAVSLFEGWIAETDKATPAPAADAGQSQPAWFGAARKYARRVAHHDMIAVRRSIAHGRAHESVTGAEEKDRP